MNLINLIRQPALVWSFSTQRVGLARDLFYAPSLEHAQRTILYHMRMMFGDELDELRWEMASPDGTADGEAYVLQEYLDGVSQGDFGYLKLVNDKIKSIEEVMDNYVELTEEEKRRKQERMEEFRRRYERMTPSGDPEDYYGPSRPQQNPFRYPNFNENQFEE